MLLKSIKLNNIRSYTNQQIDFPTGSFLLSGDIGSGKSTILLAIEFALFGSKPSELPASSLLRHGKKEGYVELGFELEGKKIFIKRNLKRTKDSIKQETGYIITNDVKKELSPVEMKSDVFDMLGYPKDLVSKGKDLIYRYTVYTPQEEMKRILIEDKDMRLNTLRKVFNIDKYKRIKENTSIYIRATKEKRREIEGFISDLEDKKKQKGTIDEEILQLDEKINLNIPKVEQIKKDIGQKKESIAVFEGKINDLNKLKNSVQVYETELKNLLRERERNNKLIENLDIQIKSIQRELFGEEIGGIDTIRQKKDKINEDLKKMNEEISKIREKINSYRIIKTKADEIIKKISTIEKCPLCLQDVKHEHKNSITQRENRNKTDAEQNILICSKMEEQIKTKLNGMEKERDELRKSENKIELVKLRMKNVNEKMDEKIKLGIAQEEIRKKVGEVNTNKIESNIKINELKNIEEDYKKLKKELDISIEEGKKLDIEKARLEKEMESLNRIIKTLEEDINKKTKEKEKLNYLVELQNWMETFFINLMGTMEKHIMLQVHREFNDLFTEWFNILIEDETISVRLDDEFTPVIDQNGYETNIETLSGGEKTSVALSYRLALNKVINDVVSSIKTKDILMLDEPTDGFSSEQLDKVRDVLELLKIKQIIIVSHESKIESFVDNIIRIGKEEHVSSIV